MQLIRQKCWSVQHAKVLLPRAKRVSNIKFRGESDKARKVTDSGREK